MILLVLASLAFATEDKIVQTYTLEKLDSAALVFRVIADGKNLCGPKLDSKKANGYLLALHPLLDQKIDETAKDQKKISLLSKQTSKCSIACHCGVYEDVMNRFPKSETQKIAIRFKNRAATLTSKQAENCAKKNLWICKDALVSYLDSEYQDSYKAK